MTNFPSYLTEEQKKFWSNLDELRVEDHPESEIHSVHFCPSKYKDDYCALIFFKYVPDGRWMYSWVNEDGTRMGIPYVIHKTKEVPFTIDDLLEISDHWFRTKDSNVLYKLAWINTQTLCVGLSIFGGLSIDLLVSDYEHSPNGKDWYPLTKKV